MISRGLNIAQLSADFAQSKKLAIDDFLEPSVVFRWTTHLKALPNEAWTVSAWPKAGMELPNHPDHRRFHNVILARAQSAEMEGKYARYFTRISGERYTDEVIEEIIAFFDSAEMKSFISLVTGVPVQFANPAIAYNYEPGSFIAEHRDKGDGRFTYVLHLSSEWDPRWGGIFEDLTDPICTETIIPKFNRLVLFDMTGQRLPHRVTAVSDDSPYNRMSISGWYK